MLHGYYAANSPFLSFHLTICYDDYTMRWFPGFFPMEGRLPMRLRNYVHEVLRYNAWFYTMLLVRWGFHNACIGRFFFIGVGDERQCLLAFAIAWGSTNEPIWIYKDIHRESWSNAKDSWNKPIWLDRSCGERLEFNYSEFRFPKAPDR